MPKPIPGIASSATAPWIIESIERAVASARSIDPRNRASAVVTNPISKAVLYEAGFKFPGHTEFLADLCSRAECESPKPIMLLVGGGLRVALATIHMPLMQVGDALSQELFDPDGANYASRSKTAIWN